MKRDYLFYSSIILCLISIGFFHINEILTGLGVILFIVSLILLLLTKKKVLSKVFLIFIFLVIGFIGIISGMMHQGGKANDEYNISENVNGRFRVIFTRNCGKIPKKNEDWNIISINDNIVYYKRPIESIYSKQRFCIVDKQGNKTWLKEIKSIDEFKGEPSILIFTPRYWKEKKVNINDYIIIKDKQTPIVGESYLDSLSHELLKECK